MKTRKFHFILILALFVIVFRTHRINALEYLLTERGNRFSLNDSSQNREMLRLLQSIPKADDSDQNQGFRVEDSPADNVAGLMFEEFIHSKIQADLNSNPDGTKVKPVSLKWNVQNLRVFHPVEKIKDVSSRLFEPSSTEAFIQPDDPHSVKWNRNSASMNYFISIFMLVTSLAVVSSLSGRK